MGESVGGQVAAATPVDAAARADGDPMVVTDGRGRTIRLREMNPGDMMDLLEAAGPASTNQGYLQYATAVITVAEIDGVPVPKPRNQDQLRAAAVRLGNDGLVAVTRHLYPGAEQPADSTAATVRRRAGWCGNDAEPSGTEKPVQPGYRTVSEPPMAP
jgi:hypothetical protein